jgi:hypothetical protein
MYFCQVFVSLNHVYQIGYNAKMKFLTLFALVTLMPSFVYAQTAELIHDQLPLPVPCYDLVPVTELTLGPP